MSTERIAIKIMPDDVEARAQVAPGEAADREAVDQALKAAGVVYGVDDEACEQLAAGLEDPDFAIAELVVARGDRPDPGRAGVLDLKFNPELLPGRVREDGTLDFRDRGMLAPVEPGQVVAAYTAPRQPKPGRSVAGAELVPKKPPDPMIPLGKGVELCKSGDIRATAAGIVCYQEDVSLSVISYFEHGGNVDLSSGDLHMEGTLLVRGDVSRNACASASGDLVVEGMVDGGTVRANGSVSISAGVIGAETSFVLAGGNLACKHADSADLRCGGVLTITRNAIKSRVTARRVAIGKGKGSVVGGEVRAAEVIQVVDVGSKLSTRTLLAICPIEDYRLAFDASGKTASRIRVTGTNADLLPRAVIQITGVAHPGVVIKLGPYELQLQERVSCVRFTHDPGQESGIRMDELRSSSAD